METETAQNIAAFMASLAACCRAAESGRDDAIICDPLAKELAGEEALGAFLMFDSKWSSQQADVVNFMALRARFADDAVRRACRGAHIRQVVLVDFVMDTRAFRVQELHQAHVYELVRPEDALEHKQRVVESTKPSLLAAKRDVIEVSLDQGNPAWPKQLRECGLDVHQPTLWVLEGVLSYVDRATSERMLTSIDELSAPGSKVWADVSGHPPDTPSSANCSGAMLAPLYGETEPKRGLLATTLQWELEEVASLGQPAEFYGRTWEPLKRTSATTGHDDPMQWHLLEGTKKPKKETR